MTTKKVTKKRQCSRLWALTLIFLKFVYLCPGYAESTSSSKSYSQLLRESRARDQVRADLGASKLNRWEVRTAPIALLASWYTLDITYRLSEHWATGPAYVGYQCLGRAGMLSPCYLGNAFGWTTNYYFRPVTRSTWYLSNHTYFEEFRNSPHGAVYTYDNQGWRSDLILGYQRRFARTSLQLGAGYQYRDRRETLIRARYEGDRLGEQSRDQSGTLALECKYGIEF